MTLRIPPRRGVDRHRRALRGPRCTPLPLRAQTPPVDVATRYRETADRLIDAALADSTAYVRLGRMVDTFGSRFSGSAALERAIDWVLREMAADGLDGVRGEPVMVPHWVRGRESAELVRPRAYSLHLIGLGGSVGTPPGGITAPVLVVGSFDELTRRSAEAKGKIVLFDVPFDTTLAPFSGLRAGGPVSRASDRRPPRGSARGPA